MDTVLFVLMLAACAMVLGWYMRNEFEKAPGDKGLLGVRGQSAAPSQAAGSSYRLKPARQRLVRAEGEAAGRYRPIAAAPAYGDIKGAAFRERAQGYREKPRRATEA